MINSTITPPKNPVIGMKALTNSGEKVTLFEINDEVFFSLFWRREDGTWYATDPRGLKSLSKPSRLSIERWEILNSEAE